MGKRLSIRKGQRYGLLVVIREIESRYKKRCFLVKCDCGEKREVVLGALRSENTQSCGCLNLEINTKHGESQTPLNQVWKDLRCRCNNPNHHNWKHYGGRALLFA